MICILILIATLLRRSAESIATPDSVNAKGKVEACFNVLNRSQFATSSIFSTSVSLS
jgi:hypothetical protein